MNPPTEPATQSAMTLRRYSILVCWGMVVTNLGQFSSLGELPIKFLLKDVLHASQTELAAWLAIAILPWTFKPVAALLVDGVPIKGTRHRYYLLLSLLFGGIFWIAMGLVPPRYHVLLFFGTCLNVMMMLTSTVVGGLLVEGGQAYGATGRLSAIRMIVANVILLFVGPLGGLLVGVWFGWTAMIGGLLFFSMIPVTLLLLREKRQVVGQHGKGPMAGIIHQCRAVFASRNIWICSGLLFLVSLAPGFGTPLLFYQTNELGFEPTFLGLLKTFGAPMGLLAALLYPFLCRKLNLRALLYLSISSTVVCTLLYLGYVSKPTAIGIEALGVLGYTLAQLPLFDLAARATPKGSEALGYAVMLAVWNLSTSISEVLGAFLVDAYQFTFNNLVWLNGGTTALVLLVIPFLPAILVDKKEGET